MSLHDPVGYSAHSSRVAPRGHEHNGSKLVLIAPCRKNLAFTFSSSFGSRNLHHICHAKPPKLANLPCACILVGKPSAEELKIVSTRWIGKTATLALHEVCRLQRSCSAGISRYDDDVRRHNQLVDDERPPRGSQKRFPNNGRSNDDSRDQCEPNR
jgi:hypothetical protein